MAASGYTPILLYASGTTTNVPLAANMTSSASGAELALNYFDGKLFYKDASGNVQVLATKGGVGSSTTTQVLYNSSGLVVGSANMVFDGSTLTTLNSAYTGTLTGGTGIVNLGSGQFYIDGSGNVGIGTSSPGQPVELVKNQNAVTWYSVINTNASSGAAAGYLMTNNTGTLGALQLNSSTNTTSGPVNALVLRTLSTNPLCFGTNSTEAMRIDSSGNLLVGTTSALGNLTIGSGSGSTSTSSYLNAGTGGNALIGRISGSNTWFLGDTYSAIGSGTGMINYVYGANPWIVYTNGGERMRIDSSGNVLVGTTSAIGNGQFVVKPAGAKNGYTYYAGADNQNGASFFNASSTQVGSIYCTNSLTAYITSSDYRLKENIAPMTGALDKISALKPCTYTWKLDGTVGQGFIAHELQAVVPDCVTGEKDAVDAEGNPKYQGIDTSFLVATLTAAIQEQQALITDLQTRLTKAGL